MKKVYFECNMGAAGDMLCGALLDTVDKNKRAEIVEKINSVGFPNAKISAVDDVKRGLVGTKFNVYVTAQNAHSHTSISEVFEIINTLNFEECVKNDAKSIYKIIADAESAAHGISVADVHLHEVGMIDAIVDVVSFCFIKKELEIDKIYASPITVGYGSVKTAHGIMNVPAPATAAILADVPIKGGDIEDELCTPTGAAILKYFCTDFSVLGDFEYDCVGVGNGTKDFERANCVRAFVGNCDSDDVCELRCQIDDMTGEEMGYAINKLLALGALDAYVQNIVMKKSRPAFLLTVIVNRIDKSLFIRQIFKHTTTLGVRILECERYRLSREIKEYEKVRVKRSSGFGAEKIKIEYDDIAKFADENNLSFFKAREQLIDKIDK
jgi:uncharacterized protein (TIGR00299 family) protein